MNLILLQILLMNPYTDARKNFIQNTPVIIMRNVKKFTIYI